MFLGFDGLMQSVAVASSEHHTTGKFIDDDYLTVSYDVIHVAASSCYALSVPAARDG